jgi:hypothetical protein
MRVYTLQLKNNIGFKNMILSVIQFLTVAQCSLRLKYTMEPVQIIGKKKNPQRKIERQRKRIARRK